MKTTKFCNTGREWIGQITEQTEQNGIRPFQDKLKAKQEIKEPRKSLGELIKKKNNWNWTTEHSEAVNKLKTKPQQYRVWYIIAPFVRTQ